jgi:alpha-tubulin suppressor-like RCC1 family protein
LSEASCVGSARFSSKMGARYSFASMASFRIVLVAFASAGVAIAACVGDDTNTPDGGGKDATLDQTIDNQLSDQSSSDAATCGVCDGSCYDDVCNGAQVVGAAMGYGYGCALLKDGTVWCWGNNAYGEVKNPPGGVPGGPVQIVGLSNVTGIVGGAAHVCAVESDASVWCWGINDYGELGHTPGTGGDLTCFGNAYCNPIPSKVAGIPAKQVGVGRWTTCAVTTTGGLSCWGFNGSGQLGQGGAPSDGTATPTVVPGLPSVSIIRVSKFPGDNVCVIDTTHSVWCWGNNDFGQLGNGAKTGNQSTCYEPGLPMTHTCNSVPTKLTTITNVVDVAPSNSTCAALTDGTVWCWGEARGGEMGNGPFDAGSQLVPTQVANVSNATNVEGNQTMCAMTNAGSISCWGVARFGVPGGFGIDAGCLDQAGNATSCQLTPAPITGVVATSFPRVNFHSAIVLTAGGPLAWGGNDQLQLGHPHSVGDDENLNNPTPTAVQGLP